MMTMKIKGIKYVEYRTPDDLIENFDKYNTINKLKELEIEVH